MVCGFSAWPPSMQIDSAVGGRWGKKIEEAPADDPPPSRLNQVVVDPAEFCRAGRRARAVGGTWLCSAAAAARGGVPECIFVPAWGSRPGRGLTCHLTDGPEEKIILSTWLRNPRVGSLVDLQSQFNVQTQTQKGGNTRRLTWTTLTARDTARVGSCVVGTLNDFQNLP